MFFPILHTCLAPTQRLDVLGVDHQDGEPIVEQAEDCPLVRTSFPAAARHWLWGAESLPGWSGLRNVLMGLSPDWHGGSMGAQYGAGRQMGTARGPHSTDD